MLYRMFTLLQAPACISWKQTCHSLFHLDLRSMAYHQRNCRTIANAKKKLLMRELLELNSGHKNPQICIIQRFIHHTPNIFWHPAIVKQDDVMIDTVENNKQGKWCREKMRTDIHTHIFARRLAWAINIWTTCEDICEERRRWKYNINVRKPFHISQLGCTSILKQNMIQWNKLVLCETVFAWIWRVGCSD